MARIVLIDDEARLLETLAKFLAHLGHDVVQASSFETASPHLHPGRFEVLVTDIVMPRCDGIQVLREVVDVRKCQEPVILITGEPNLETATEAVRRGAFDYVSKPVTKDKLIEVVTRGLRHVKLLRERDAARATEMQLLKNLALLGESASVLSHEIRTPINSLRHALRAVADRLDIEHQVLLEELAGSIERIERMLGSTLSFARPLRPDLQTVSLADLARRTIGELERLSGFAGMGVSVDIPSPLQVVVDPQLFAEVLSNLLRNAAEACGRNGHVKLRASAGPSGLRVDVEDDGPGVPEHLRDEIFKPFHSSKSGGTGLGLAFSRKVIESHGGSLVLVGGAHPGACFRIELPSAAVAAA